MAVAEVRSTTPGSMGIVGEKPECEKILLTCPIHWMDEKNYYVHQGDSIWTFSKKHYRTA